MCQIVDIPHREINGLGIARKMFKPGQSGNPAGSRKGKVFEDALRRAIAQDDGQKVRAAIDKMIDLAANGEKWACEMLAERLDGKVAQALIHSGDDERPPIGLVERKLIK